MSGSVKVTFLPSRTVGEVTKGTTLLEAARLLGIDLEGPCAGTGRCSKDIVQVRTGRTLETVLACKTAVHEDIEVTIPSRSGKERVKAVEGFYFDAGFKLEPAVGKSVKGDPASTSVYMDGELVAVEKGDTANYVYGVAVDIGTTTLAVSLVDLLTGETLGSSSTLNPLVHYGHDVMSRIRYSATDGGLKRMHTELISAIDLLIEVLAAENSVERSRIYRVAAAGNTTMQHIFLNKNIKSIGEYPYTAEVLGPYSIKASALGIKVAESAVAFTMPCVSAYVGGDITSGLMAVGPEKMALPALFIDIGTNGEIALVLEDRLITSSTAAGPCFEGMTINCGMRAAEGAIERVAFGDGLSYETIGGGVPKGICGSGLLDLVAGLVKTGIVNQRGRLRQSSDPEVPGAFREHLYEKDGKRYFAITPEISVSQDDIRQVQLAKAAIRAGVELLMRECGISAQGLKSIIIAGGFGYHLKNESILEIGMLPSSGAGVLFVGNSSLAGAVKALLDKNFLGKAGDMARGSQNIDLSRFPDFEQAYVREIGF